MRGKPQTQPDAPPSRQTDDLVSMLGVIGSQIEAALHETDAPAAVLVETAHSMGKATETLARCIFDFSGSPVRVFQDLMVLHDELHARTSQATSAVQFHDRLVQCLTAARAMARALQSAAAEPMRPIWTARCGSGRSSTAALARAKMVSPSKGVCAGRTARAIPSWAIMATRLHSTVVKSALHATTPKVVLAPACNRPSAMRRDFPRAPDRSSPWDLGVRRRRRIPGPARRPKPNMSCRRA